VIEAHEHENILFLRVPTPADTPLEAEQLGQELREWGDTLGQREELLGGVVLTSARSTFCVSEPRTTEDVDLLAQGLAPAARAIARLQSPTVAVIEGDAVGPAWELALACDLRVAAAKVRVGSPEVRFGRLPSCGGTQRLVRMVGTGVALRLLLLGELPTAPTALALGLLHRVAQPDELEAVVDEILRALRVSATNALAYAKEVVHASADVPLEMGLRLETDLSVLLQTTVDRAEGLSAFLERRPAHFKGH
jgi:enoyl-CoA hydratase